MTAARPALFADQERWGQMTYRYPTGQILLGFGFLAVGTVISSVVAAEIMLGAFGLSPLIQGGSLYLVPLDIPPIAAVAACIWSFRYFYLQKRPIAIDQTGIASLDFWGRTKSEMPWAGVNRIDRQPLYDPFSYRNAYCFDVCDSGDRTIWFDDTITEYKSLVAELNRQIVAHNIVANSIARGPDVLLGVTDPIERRRLVKYGRPSRVASFDEQQAG